MGLREGGLGVGGLDYSFELNVFVQCHLGLGYQRRSQRMGLYVSEMVLWLLSSHRPMSYSEYW